MAQRMYAKSFPWQESPASDGDPHEESTSDESVSGSRDTTEPTPSRGNEERQPISVVGQTLVFKGDLSASEDLLIQGRIEGSITHDADNLTVGAHGDVRADIVARRVIIQGKVEGDVRASESVAVEASAQVEGNLRAPSVGLKEGAKFKGGIDMDDGGRE
jgi:cytoskeletal protein CcmA (bactofilin family)